MAKMKSKDESTAADAAPAELMNGKTISKMEGVRRSLKKLGNDAKPQDIQLFLKKKFHIDMATAVISSYKTTILKKVGDSPAEKSVPGKTVPAATQRVAGISLEDIQAVKALTERLGADKVRQLAAVLAK